MSHSYEVIICPKCRVQLDPEYGDCEHDGIYYHGVHQCAQLLDSAGDEADLRAAVESMEAAHRKRLEREATDRAELERMEAEWRATATAEQVEHYERAQAQAAEIRVSMHDTIKRVYGNPRVLAEMSAPSPLLALLGEDWQEGRDARVRRDAEKTIARFEAHGPAAVDFTALREARRRLAELDSRP